MQNIFFDHSGMKLGNNNGKKSGKLTNIWKLNSTIKQPMGQRKKKITRELRKCFEMNEDITYQNLYDAAKAMIKRKLIATNAYIKSRKDLKSII